MPLQADHSMNTKPTSLISSFGIKSRNSLQITSKYTMAKHLEKKKKNLLKSITDINLRERIGIILPTQDEFRSAAYCAKKKGIPLAPRRLEDLAFSLLNTDSRNM